MKVLFEQGGYAFENVGDWAMLQVAVNRLREAVPAAEVTVVATESAPLEACLSGVRCWALGERDILLEAGYLFGRRPRLARWVRAAARREPRRFRAVLRTKELLGRKGMAERYATALATIERADAVVASGGGFITDTFPEMVRGVLGTLAFARRLGKPTAMFGQGLGPLVEAQHRQTAAEVLPRLGCLTLREPIASVEVARIAGVAADRAVVTGDDATELAYHLRPERLGQAVGFNLRLARYSGVDDELSRGVGAIVQDFACGQGVAIAVLPISLVDGKDWDDTWRALGEQRPPECPVSTPEDAIRIAGRCRVTVTGSYHAGVFSLSQGVPVIGLVRSPYYADKFRGLAALYPDACVWVDLSKPEFVTHLRGELERLFAMAAELRPGTLERSHTIVHDSRQAHFGFYDSLPAGARGHR